MLIPRRTVRTSQPQHPAPPVAPDYASIFNAADGQRIWIKGVSHPFAGGTPSTAATGSLGKARLYNGSTQYDTLPAGALTSGAPVTRLCVLTWAGGRSTISSDVGTNGSFLWEIQADGSLVQVKTNFVEVLKIGGVMSVGETAVLATSWDGATSKLYKNGNLIGSTAYSSGFSAGSVPAIGRHFDNVFFFNGKIYFHADFPYALIDAAVKALSANPWQIFEDEEDYLFVPDASGGGSVSLIVADALHGHAVDSPSFSMATYLAVAESLHTQAADNLTLSTTGSANLAIQEAAHAHVSDGVALTTRWLLIVADALHTHAADNLTMGVTGATTLTVADATSVHTADSVALSVIAFLAIADAVSQHAADNLTLDTSNSTFLTVQDAAHAHSSDGTGLSLNTWLAIVEAAHSHTADAPVLSAATALVVAESLHAQFADVVVLSFPSSGSCPTASEIAAAVLAALNATTGTRTVGQHLQIQTAVLAGNETGAGTTHVTFTDGTAVVEADVPLPGAIGNRTNVTTSV